MMKMFLWEHIYNLIMIIRLHASWTNREDLQNCYPVRCVNEREMSHIKDKDFLWKFPRLRTYLLFYLRYNFKYLKKCRHICCSTLYIKCYMQLLMAVNDLQNLLVHANYM